MVNTTCGNLINPFFVQYTCLMSPEEQHQKFRGLCYNVFFGLLTCCSFAILVRWLFVKGKLNQIEWDMATTSAGDFSVELHVHKKDYLRWYNDEYRQSEDFNQDVPPSMALKKHIIEVFETELTNDLKREQ